MQNSSPLLAVNGLTVSFGAPRGRSAPAVNGIDFAVERGQTLAVVGESGSGKSASLLGIVGLLPPTAQVTGDVRFAGRSLLELDRRDLRSLRGAEIGVIFQDPNTSLHPQKTIGAQIEETLRLHSRLGRRARHDRVLQLLERVGIGEPRRAFSAFPFEYSGGMRQRAMIAMAIANQPQLLIADEPTTALDATVQASIISLLADLQRADGTSIVFVNHDLAVVHQLAHRVIVMRHGTIVEHGTRDEVYGSPQHPYTIRLLAASALHSIDSLTGTKTTTEDPPPATAPGDPAASPEPAVLEVRDLRKSYRGRGRRRARRLVVEGLSFGIRTGEIVALVGESGSGKSTVGKIVAGLLHADSGTVRLLGRDLPTSLSDAVPALARAQRRTVQLVFQDSYSSLNPRRRVRESILQPLAATGTSAAEAAERLRDVARRTGIGAELLDRFPAQLSGGQRQRVALARALILRPRLVVTDESISALDVTSQAEIIELIRATRRESQTSFLFITHDLGVVRHLADQVIVLSPDGVEDAGTPAQVFESPRSAYTRALVAAVPRITRAAS